MNQLRHLTNLARLLADELAAVDGAAFAMAEPKTIGVPNGPTATLGSVARTYARLRRKRDTMFGRSIFADPAWDLLLDLFAADAENRTVSISSACIAASVPPTTALRCIRRLESEGIVERLPDAADRRRSYLRLAPMTHEMVASWLTAYAQQHSADAHVAYVEPVNYQACVINLLAKPNEVDMSSNLLAVSGKVQKRSAFRIRQIATRYEALYKQLKCSVFSSMHS